MADTGLTEATIPPQNRRAPIENESDVAWPTPADNPDLPPPPAEQDRASVDLPATATTEDTAARQNPGNQTSTPYQYDPQVMAEHALLGSLLHSPAAFDALKEFLSPRDFATRETRHLYTTLRALHQTQSLVDAAAMPTPQLQLAAAEENHQKVRTALHTGIGQYRIARIDETLAGIITAAPPEALPYRGVYDPAAQLRLGRMVLEDSIRRQMHQMGVQLTRVTNWKNAATRTPQQAAHAARATVDNLTSMVEQLDGLAARLVSAVHRTGSDADPAVEQSAKQRTGRRLHLPDLVRPIAAPLRHRAERQLIHLALHAGRLDQVPEQILNIAPEDFADRRHANTWRVIQDLRARDLPVNYVAVLREAHADDFGHQPILNAKALSAMAGPPEARADHVFRTLRTVVTSALSRARSHGQQAINISSRNHAITAQQAIETTRSTLTGLAERARTAADAHQHLTARNDTAPTRRTQ